MLTPIITPSQTAVTLAVGSASRIGAMIGTTTTAISMKSRKNPSRKMTPITTTNLVMKPPGSPVRKSRTKSSPPKARKAAVSMAAPSRMMKTRAVVLAVSIITPSRVSSILKTRQPLHVTEARKTKDAIVARTTPRTSSLSLMFLTLMSKYLSNRASAMTETTTRRAGVKAPRLPSTRR